MFRSGDGAGFRSDEMTSTSTPSGRQNVLAPTIAGGSYHKCPRAPACASTRLRADHCSRWLYGRLDLSRHTPSGSLGASDHRGGGAGGFSASRSRGPHAHRARSRRVSGGGHRNFAGVSAAVPSVVGRRHDRVEWRSAGGSRQPVAAAVCVFAVSTGRQRVEPVLGRCAGDLPGLPARRLHSYAASVFTVCGGDVPARAPSWGSSDAVPLSPAREPASPSWAARRRRASVEEGRFPAARMR